MFLTVALCFSMCVPSMATDKRPFEFTDKNDINLLNSTIQETSVRFLKVSLDEIIYTFERDGTTYKYIDDILSSNKVKTDKYQLRNGAYEYCDTTYYTISNTLIEGYSLTTGHFVVDLSANTSAHSTASDDYNWQYHHSNTGSTAIDNMTLTAIAIAIGTAVGGPFGVFLAVASYLFDKNVQTVYFTVYVYKDLNSPNLRPNYKHVVYTYTDSDHEKPTDPSSTFFIVES